MSAYFVRRVLMVPLTFLVITFIVYAILRVVPGGPIQQAEAQQHLHGGEGGGGGGGGQLQMSEEGLESLAAYYALDEPIPVGYLQWLGLWPRERDEWIPPVPKDRHAKVAHRLAKLEKARDQARVALAKHLKERSLIAYHGKLYRAVDPSTLPAAERTQIEHLLERTFGARYALERTLGARGQAWKSDEDAMPLAEVTQEAYDAEEKVAGGHGLETGKLLAPAQEASGDASLAKAKTLLAGVTSAERAFDAAQGRTGYALLPDGHLVQGPLLPLLELNAVRGAAAARLDALLGPRHLYGVRGTLYRPVPKRTRRGKAIRAFFDRADVLVGKGFTGRPDLLDYLAAKGFTWRAGVYYEPVPQSVRAKDPEYFATATAVMRVRDLAQQKLDAIEAAHHVKVDPDGRLYRVVHRVAGILELDFGDSYQANQPVFTLIVERLGVSLPYVLTGYLLAWIVCVPLGVLKAIKHRTSFDNLSSIVVFIAYAVPGFVVALILLVTVAAHVSFIPLGGYLPQNADEFGFFALLGAHVRYMLIPVIAYTAGSFATMTILMKNSLLENLGQDYVRTAFAKGLTERRVIFVHALRNSLIPITAGIGTAFSLLFSGSFLIEETCNIPGMGLLGFNSILQHDYPVVMGLVVVGVLIQLFGNILSDLIWAAIDPRIRFGR